MATIKLQPSGAVVLKDGKVSCGCCGPNCIDFDNSFAYSYTISCEGISVIVTKQSPCEWAGENEYGYSGIVYEGMSPGTWFAYISLPEPFFGRDGEKKGQQISPVGQYFAGIIVS